MSSVAAELVVRGMVQGVGYRYFCYHRARELNLTGWVKNERDGNVRSLVEGDRANVEAYVEELKLGPAAASVRDVEIQWRPFSGKFQRFTIAN